MIPLGGVDVTSKLTVSGGYGRGVDLALDGRLEGFGPATFYESLDAREVEQLIEVLREAIA